MSASESSLAPVPQGYRDEKSNELFLTSRYEYVVNRDANTRGTANPSIMNNPFWVSQTGPDRVSAYNARIIFGGTEEPWADTEDPVWCFIRFGATRTRLPDGRLVCIGGEHEDSYDPDFCIYNDVVVFDAPQKTNPPPLLTPDCIKIYGYPVDVFPPTDFHTSTYYADPLTGKESIFIIGGVGYAGQASRDRAEIYRLDLSDFSIHKIDTSGQGPIGGTYNHKAEILTDNEHSAIILMTGPEEGEESNKKMYGEKSAATAKIEKPLTTDNDEEPRVMTPDKVFTLRIRDMRWI